MKQPIKSAFTTAAVLTSILVSGSALAELSANAALTTNYVFRGVTQTDDGPAVQGGLDYSHESGAYAGTWASNVEDGFEVDLYVGYAGETQGFGYDVGYITYEYTDSDFFDGAFRELHIGGSYGPVSLTYYDGKETQDDTDYTYIDLGAEFDVSEITLGLHYGIFDPDISGADSVTDYSVSVAKEFNGFNVSATATSEDANDENEFFLTVAKDFDL